MLKALTVFALAGASIALVPASRPGDGVLPLTPGALRGTIGVVSFGVATLTVDDKPLSALHVRATFANRGDNVPWTFELAASRVALSDERELQPVLVNSDVKTLPILVVGRGEQRIADLYFALPSTESPSELTFKYRVNTPDSRFLGRARLARAPRTPTDAERLPALGWGASWWADPWFPWPGYDRHSGRMVPRVPKQIAVLRAPRAFYEEQPAGGDGDEDWPRTDECDDW
jgi:hypothetical protein